MLEVLRISRTQLYLPVICANCLKDIIIYVVYKLNIYSIKDVSEATARSNWHGLYLKGIKCEIMVKETIFLGHQISRRGVEISPKKRVDFEDINMLLLLVF